jgi:cysteinyl-tRNA synthetase
METIKIYNSFEKKYDQISTENTIIKGKIKMYSCGPTVYKYQHIGNLRAAFLPDIFCKVATIAGFGVDWVLNVTDVGHLVGDGDDGQDKLELSAKQENKTPEQIAQFYLQDYFGQVNSIGLDIPTGKYLPKATDFIESQMRLVLELLKQKFAYVQSDGIYFDSSTLNSSDFVFNFGQTGSRTYTDREIIGDKKTSGDFALWKFVSEKTLQKWKFNQFDSLAGVMIDILNIPENSDTLDLPNRWGVPGWHSECVAMIWEILGGGLFNIDKSKPLIDIHFGGEDHIDIHHRNEILQAQALGVNLSKNWVHNKFVTVDGEKMSKSLGNVYLAVGEKVETGVDSILSKGFCVLSYRMMLFEHHYNNSLNFTWEKLEQSQIRLFNMRKECAKVVFLSKNQKINLNLEDSTVPNSEMMKILCDNLNTPKFLENFSNLLNLGSSREILDKEIYQQLLFWEINLLNLGLFPEIPDYIWDLGQQRVFYKDSKDYQQADKIREKILDYGYVIEDYSSGFGLWKNK